MNEDENGLDSEVDDNYENKDQDKLVKDSMLNPENRLNSENQDMSVKDIACCCEIQNIKM